MQCQTAGEIAGKVIDVNTNEPLIGANIVIKGTALGAAADVDGNYIIRNIPPGEYTLRASYIGYRSEDFNIQVIGDSSLTHIFKMSAVAVQNQEVVVTAQAVGQNAAINQQLSSEDIVNVVSSARIKELPDANAAESVGRLPGVYLVRDNGEGSEISIRGLEPKYNMVMIDGVEMASTAADDRSTDLSMISSDILSGIEVYKTIAPDMDAAVLGGVVNFQLQEAKNSETGGPEIKLSSQGGYNRLQNASNDYKFSASVGNRFFNDKLGLIIQGVVENKNLPSDEFGGSYALQTFNLGVQNKMKLNSLNLSFNPSIRKRYDATVGIDYRMPDGKINFTNFFSNGTTKTESYSQTYDLLDNQISYGLSYSPKILNTITDLVDVQQKFLSFDVNAKISHSLSENSSPGYWSWSFLQGSAGLDKIPANEDPQLIASSSNAKTNVDNLFLNGLTTSNSFTMQRNITGALDMQKDFVFSDLISSTLKFGGKYRYTYRTYKYSEGDGGLYAPNLSSARQTVLQSFPWMTQPPYNLPANGSAQLPMSVFIDPNVSARNFLKGNYAIGPLSNFGLLGKVTNIMETLTPVIAHQANVAYTVSSYNLDANNYTGTEDESAGYAMMTVHAGPQVTIVGGVRYQALRTSYTAARFFNADAANPYPDGLPHTDTTTVEYHGFWLPDVSLKYRAVSWLNIRASYTNTLTYPDFNSITPVIDVGNRSVTYHDFSLTPARSQNYDIAFSFYTNSIGLLTINPFLKQIDNLIFSESVASLTDPSAYPGVPSFAKGFALGTDINDPYRVNDWGIETDWQTHFWYLPDPFSGLVFDINYTHIFSGAHYPYVLTSPGVFPTYVPTYADTFYVDRLIDQPNNIVNLSTGYDYKDFSIVVSMIYQEDVFTGTNFWPELRSSKAKYLRWDLSLKQNLPWFGLTAFFDLNNINGASDESLIRGTGFPSAESQYGMTGDLGLRWSL